MKHGIYNYEEAVRADVRTWIADNVNLEEWRGRAEKLEEYLNDTLWTEDSVTGNGSGSYWMSAWDAADALAHNWDEILETAYAFGIESKISDGYEYGAEWWDVSIRCRYLSLAISEALEDLTEELEEVSA